MCTVSWWRREGALSLRFNRDEQRGRAVASPPCINEQPLIWPKDPQGGGTWICLDRWGTVHCVLNHYDAEMVALPPNPESRGALPLLSAKNPERAVSDWLTPGPYPPFHLFRIPLQGETSHVTWDGQHLELRPVHTDLTLWTTSGWNAHEVIVSRASLFDRMINEHGLSEDTLTAFHYAFDAENPGRWPRMSRGDARTVSYSEIRVTEKEMTFEYTAFEGIEPGPATSCKQVCLPLKK